MAWAIVGTIIGTIWMTLLPHATESPRITDTACAKARQGDHPRSGRGGGAFVGGWGASPPGRARHAHTTQPSPLHASGCGSGSAAGARARTPDTTPLASHIHCGAEDDFLQPNDKTSDSHRAYNVWATPAPDQRTPLLWSAAGTAWRNARSLQSNKVRSPSSPTTVANCTQPSLFYRPN